MDDLCDEGLHRIRFDTASLRPGVYLYRLTAEGRTLTRRLIVLH